MDGADHAEELESLRREVRALAAIVAATEGGAASSRGERSRVGCTLKDQSVRPVNPSRTGMGISRPRASTVAPTVTVGSRPESVFQQEGEERARKACGELHGCRLNAFCSSSITSARCFVRKMGQMEIDRR